MDRSHRRKWKSFSSLKERLKRKANAPLLRERSVDPYPKPRICLELFNDTVLAAAVEAVMPAVDKYNNHGRAKGARTGKNTEPRPSLASLDVNKLLAKNSLEIEEKRERKRKENEYTHTNFEELEEKLRGKRISHERERKLADESCEEEWVKDHRATENWLLENGFTKEELKYLVDYYKNLLDKGTMVPRRYHEKYI
eukprot:scaffold2632_cov124-Skeletonema_menzelii.AAC.8